MKLNSYKLCVAMAKAGITSGELCKATGLSSKSISMYISGRMSPRPIIIGKLSDATKVSVEFLTT